MASDPAVHRSGRVRIGRTLLIGAVSQVVLLAIGVAIAFATDWTDVGQWLAAPVIGMVAALFDLLKQTVTTNGAPAPRQTDLTGRDRAPKKRRRTPLVVGILLTVALIGGGGWAVASGVGYLTAFVTGNEVGEDRLTADAVIVDNGIEIEVASIEQTVHFTRVSVVVRNNLDATVDASLMWGCTLSDSNGTVLEVDGYRSSWTDKIAPHTGPAGVLVFPGHLSDAATTATLSFPTVIVLEPGGPRSLTVPGLALKPFAE